MPLAPDNLRRRTTVAFRRLNAGKHPVPDFIIIGAQKAGTTSLYEYLCQHPLISRSLVKETHYFDLRYARGERWYRAQFPVSRRSGELAGESTPYYLFHPLVPTRIARDLPGCRFIVILRNPIDRAVSHYNHVKSLGLEELDLETALAREPERLSRGEHRILADGPHASLAHQRYSYLARGRYAEQLEHWFEHIDRSQFLILSSEELFEQPRDVVAACQRFLGLDAIQPSDLRPRNARTYAPIEMRLRERLRAEFEEANRSLYRLLGRDLGWS